MQTKPYNWDAIRARPHIVEPKVTIGQNVYEADDIVSLHTSGALYEDFGIGNCCARTMDVEFYPTSAPARQAQVDVYVRLKDTGNSQTTDWVHKGTYFVSKRETNHTTGTLRLTCYDAMLKAEQPFTEVFPSYANFPAPPSTVVSTIAAAMGVTLDSRNVINSTFLVGYPVDEDGDMTLREMLGRIAVANAGNWVISDANQLRLVPLSTTATPIALGSDCASLEKGIVSDSIENVEILDNNGDIIQKYPATTVSGKTLYAANPDATYLATDMARAVYNAVHGYVQYGFTANSAIIDPCAELGDRVTVGTTGDTLTSTIANEAISFSYLYTSDIGAPDADEVEDEYPYATMEQRVKREVAGAYSAIKKSAESIEAIVKGIAKPYNESTTYHQYDVVFKDKKYWMCNVQTASVPWDTSEWTEQSSGALSSIIKQTMDSITLGVASSGHSTSISIAAGGVTVNSSQTTIQGAVTCDSVSADKITAGELDANNIILKNEFSIKNQSNNVVAKIGAAQGNDGVSTTLGAVLAGVPQSGETNNNSYFIVTNAGARMQCGQYSLYVTNSGWFKNYNGTVTGLGDAVFG